MASGFRTGYVHEMLDKNFSFAEFIWNSARAMGAFLHMRDDSGSAKLYWPTEPESYYADRVDEAEEALACWLELTPSQREQAILSQLSASRASSQQYEQESADEDERVTKMQQRVRGWQVGDEYSKFKKFLLEQLGSDEPKRPREGDKPLPTGGELSQLVADHEVELRRDVTWRQESLAEEVKHIANRVRWIEDLRKLVPIPEHMLDSRHK